MRRLRQLSGALVAAVAVAGCGGSTHATTSSKTASAATASSTSTGTTTSSSTPTATTTSPSTPSATTTTPTTTTKAHIKTTTTSSSGGVSAQPSSGGGSSSSGGPAGGSASARVPATFTIHPGESVSPATVSAPAFLAVQLTVVSGDGRAHSVVVLTPHKHTLSVSAHSRASVLLPGLKAGDYAVTIDGKPRAKLVIGGEPGP